MKEFVELKCRVSEELEYTSHILNPSIIEYVLVLSNDSEKCIIGLKRKEVKRYFGKRIKDLEVYEPYWLVKEKLKVGVGGEFIELNFTSDEYKESVCVLLNVEEIGFIVRDFERKNVFCFLKGLRRRLAVFRTLRRNGLCIDETYEEIKEIFEIK